MSSSFGISRLRWSGCCLFAPCFARVLLPLFSLFPSCPLIHRMVVLADLCLIRWAAFLKNLVFFMSIHLSSSQESRWAVRPSIMYFESVYILTGWYGGIVSNMAIIAAISPIWLDWAFPGIHRARFLGSSHANQTPLPQCAFFLLLFMQAPLVYIMISLHLGVGPWCLYLCAM